MLTADEVIRHVRSHLEQNGYATTRTAPDCGFELYAKKEGSSLVVKAKGATSANGDSDGYEAQFDRGRNYVQFAVALVQATELEAAGLCPALAFPDDRHYRLRTQASRPGLTRLGYPVFWVHADGSVSQE